MPLNAQTGTTDETKNETKTEPTTPEELPPEQAERAREIMASMPEGRDPTPTEQARARPFFIVLSAAAIVALLTILVLVGRDLPTLIGVLLITLGYVFGMLPLIGAAIYRKRDREEAVRRARREASAA